MSKILERVAYNQLYNYLSNNNLLYDLQSGFRQGYCTDTALIHLVDVIRSNMDKSLITGVVLIDLQKAFDTVDHNILAMKLEAIGLDIPSVQWFNSYISERKQFVEISHSKSDQNNVTCGVPQGSILGPLLFSIYVNDMIQAVNCDLYLYADDSALVISGNDCKILETQLCTELKHLVDWLEENKLSIHLGKTESILFGSHQKLRKCNVLNISCNGVSVKASKTVKYLGVYLDQNMNFNSMGTTLVKKLNTRIRFLFRKQCYLLSIKERKMLGYALVQSLYDYACNSWFRGLSANLKHRLQTAQNKLIRFILKYEPRQSVNISDFKRLSMLNVAKRVDYLALVHMFKISQGIAPTYLNKAVHVTHSHNTRRSNLAFSVPQVKSQGAKTFNYNGIILWNNLPNEIKTSLTVSVFKSQCKVYCLNQMHNEAMSLYT